MNIAGCLYTRPKDRCRAGPTERLERQDTSHLKFSAHERKICLPPPHLHRVVVPLLLLLGLLRHGRRQQLASNLQRLRRQRGLPHADCRCRFVR